MNQSYVCNWMTSLGFYLKHIFDPTRSNPHTLPVVRDVIQLDNFTLLVSQADPNLTQYTPHQLPVVHGIIQIFYSHCNYIRRHSPTKASHTLIFLCSRCLIISLENISSVTTNCNRDSFQVGFNPRSPLLTSTPQYIISLKNYESTNEDIDKSVPVLVMDWGILQTGGMDKDKFMKKSNSQYCESIKN